MTSRLVTATWSTFQPSLALPDLEANLSLGPTIAEAFVDVRLFEAEDWTPCRNMEVADFFDELDRCANEADESLIVYLCSHGLVPVTGPFRLATSRTVRPDDTARAIGIHQVLDTISRSNAADKALIVDACFAGQAGGPLTDSVLIAPSSGSPAQCTVLASTSAVDLAKIDQVDGFPIFSKQLVGALQNLKSHSSGKITLAKLYEETKALVQAVDPSAMPRLFDVDGLAQRILPRNGSGQTDLLLATEPEPRVSILFADDEDQWHEEFRRGIDHPGVAVTYATTSDSARTMLETSHFDILVLDLMFNGVPASDLFRAVSALPYEPDVFLATRLGQGEVAWEDIDSVLSYPSPIDALVFKHKDGFIVDTRELAVDILEQRKHVLQKIDGAAAAAAQVGTRVGKRSGLDGAERRSAISALESEVLTLIHEVFEQWLEEDDEDSYVEKFKISPLGGGRSSCSVFAVTPEIADFASPPVSDLILKIGPRDEIQEEVRRYERYVQVGIPLSLRTDKIKHHFGCQLGAVLYSFLGDDGEGIDELGDSPLSTIVSAIRTIMAPTGRRWYASVSNHRIGLLKYFAENNFDYQAFRRTIVEANQQLDSMSFNGNDAAADRFDPDLLDSTSICGQTDVVLIHGDLHLGNIVCYSDDRFALIDYRNVGPGPRLVDFATLELDCWIRGECADIPRQELIETYLRTWAVLDQIESEMSRTPDLDDLEELLEANLELVSGLPDFCQKKIEPIALCRRAAYANFGEIPTQEYSSHLWLAALRRWSFKSAWATADERRSLRTAPLVVGLGAQHRLLQVR